MKTIAFFSNNNGVGNTSLVYHLAQLFGDRSIKVLVADLDPQADLSAMFLEDQRLMELWGDGRKSAVADCLQPLIDRTGGDIAEPHVETVTRNIGLVTGSLALSRFEDPLAESWPACLSGDVAAFRMVTAFHRIVRQAAKSMHAELVLLDVGPNLGAINRAALIAADQVILPLAPDLFSLQGLLNLGLALRGWRKGWKARLDALPDNAGIDTPAGEMTPLGYLILQHAARGSRPIEAHQRWMDRIPGAYRGAVLDELLGNSVTVPNDPLCLSLLKHYRSLMPLAMDAHKPMFSLKPADGAIGAHVEAVKACYGDFLMLGRRIGELSGFVVD